MTFESFRCGIQHTVYRIIDPSVRFMLKIGVTPNMITTLGLVGNFCAAFLLVWSAQTEPIPNYFHIGIAGALILFSSIFDMVDGYMARTGNLCSEFGAFYDSVLDRYCELFTLSAIAIFFMEYGFAVYAAVSFLSLIGSIMVSYIRARAEGLGKECKVGLMQRPERVVVTSLGAILTPFLSGYLEEPLLSLFIPQVIIAVLANYTAGVRIAHVKKQMDQSITK